MRETLEFLESAGVYYLATCKDNKPYVRPFGTVMLFENKLYIQTGKVKNCYKEMKENPFVEISAFINGKWIRINGKIVEDDRVEARIAMLDKYPDLRRMYNENDGNTVVLYLTDATSTIYSFTEASRTFKF